MKTIVLAHQKGGVGKSTLSIHLSYALQEKGYNVTVQDLDKQGTSYRVAQTVPVIREGEIPSSDTDYLIIDTPPYLMQKYEELFIKADVVVIPTRVSIPDILAIESTIELINRLKIKYRINAHIVMNAVNVTSNTKVIREQLESYNIPILKTFIADRVIYGNSLLEDKGVFSSDNVKAQDEIKSLSDEILNEIQ